MLKNPKFRAVSVVLLSGEPEKDGAAHEGLGPSPTEPGRAAIECESMTCEIISGNGAVFSVWGRPSRGDIDRVEEAMRSTKSSSGDRITYVTRVPVDAPAPDAEVRRHLDSRMPVVVDHCMTYHVILEGGGFVAALKRSVLVSIFQVRWRNGTFFVHRDCDEVLDEVSPERRAGVAALLGRARQLGLLTQTPGVTRVWPTP